MAKQSGTPSGVKVISVLYYIGSTFDVLFGLLFLFGAGAIGALLSTFLGGAGSMFTAAGMGAGVLLIALGVLGFFVARGLWTGKNWARIVALVFAGLGLLSALFSLVQGSFVSAIFMILVHGLIGGYLLLNKGVKAAFE